SILSIITLFIIFILGSFDMIFFILAITLAAYVVFKSSRFIEGIVDIGKYAAAYPLNIYGTAGLLLLSVVMPIGFATFYPAEAIFNKLGIGDISIIILIELFILYFYYKISEWLITKYTSGGG
ncbi:MAG: ABC-2 family transporter protein, partial [Candidatus Micrarchaeia archaeon]